MIPYTDSENKFYEEQKESHICQKEFFYDKNGKKKIENIPNISTKNTGKFRGAADSIYNNYPKKFQ